MNNDAISRSELQRQFDEKCIKDCAFCPFYVWIIDGSDDEGGYCGLIQKAPALDAVPVVRCKDCAHAAPLEGYASRKFEIGLNCRACRGDSGYGIVGLSFTVPDGYCDDGLRRAGEADD